MEVAKSADELMTSQSIEERDSPDFEFLDAKISSALGNIKTNHYRRRVNVEEQKAQKDGRLLL